MEGASTTSGKVLMDFENCKNQEWLRRRKLRLEQVRKQSHDIAKALRQKVVHEEKIKNEIYQKIREAEFRDWKAERLAYLEEKLRCALEEFGEGYKLAAAEPDPNKIIQERNKVNELIAQKRGEIAYHEELKMKKMEEEKKMFPIQRKIMTRKVEDLRSALIRSVPIKKQLSEKCNIPSRECPVTEERSLNSSKAKKNETEEINNSPSKKISENKPKKNKTIYTCKNTGKIFASNNRAVIPENNTKKFTETIWINLNDIQISSTSSSSAVQSNTGRSIQRSPKSRESKGVVEFYDFPSRYFCRSYKDFPHLVERIQVHEEPNAVELAKLDEEKEELEVKRRQEIEAITQERGFEALRREKVNRDYQNMISKLDELSKKEKILKSQQKSLPSFVHMTDERLLERTRMRQKLMNSKFESIYYSATCNILPSQTGFHRASPLECDFIDSEERTGTGLSFSASNLKQNSPVSEMSEELNPPLDPGKGNLLMDIEKVLQEGRELRRTISRDWESGSESEKTYKADRSIQASPFEGTKCQESQTDDFKPETRTDVSLPVSTSTSYISPPSEIKSSELLNIIEHLTFNGEENNDSSLRQKVKQFYRDSQKENYSDLEKGPTLEYYIKKLLNMSRECVANLSVSSDNISTPNSTDLERRNNDLDVGKMNSKREEKVGKYKLKRADRLTEVVKDWKNILAKNIQEESETSQPEDEPDGDVPVTEELIQKNIQHQLPLNNEEPRSLCPSIVQQKFDQITKKCSERISELSNMLEKVRKDKEKLLPSISGKSSDLEEDTPLRFGIRRNDSTGAVADSHSYPDESLESWPDVMNELLRKEILTSPFKWSDEETSQTQEDIPTIKTVIGDFRKELNKIKTISFLTLDSFPGSDSVKENKEEEDPEGCQESSTESINKALTSLGLNWAKSFLRKNEESRAMSSSSGDKSSEEEEGEY